MPEAEHLQIKAQHLRPVTCNGMGLNRHVFTSSQMGGYRIEVRATPKQAIGDAARTSILYKPPDNNEGTNDPVATGGYQLARIIKSRYYHKRAGPVLLLKVPDFVKERAFGFAVDVYDPCEVSNLVVHLRHLALFIHMFLKEHILGYFPVASSTATVEKQFGHQDVGTQQVTPLHHIELGYFPAMVEGALIRRGIHLLPHLHNLFVSERLAEP